MRVTDYDSISSRGYDARYREYEHTGIEAALVSFLRGVGPSSALEVGTGTGHWLKFLSGQRVVGLDLSRAMLARARHVVPDSLLVQGAAGALPFADGTFDRVICVNALHHFVNKAQFLNEARRVLRPTGGLISIGLDPHSGRDRWWIYEYFPETIDLDRQRYPSEATIRALMANAGFARCETREVEHIVGAISVESARATGHLDRSFTSQFTILTDEEFLCGLHRIVDAVERSSERGAMLLLQSDLHLYATTGWVTRAACRP